MNELTENLGREAVESGNLVALKVLVNEGLDIHSPLGTSRTLLHEACFYRRFDIISYLIESGIDMESKDIMGWTPLRYSCAHGDLDIIKYLVSKGANINSESSRKWTSLHSVAGLCHYNCLRYFIDAGANLEACTSESLTPLHVACVYGQDPRSVCLLLDKGSNIEAKDNLGNTSLHLSCENGQLDIVNTLLSYECNPLGFEIKDYWSPRIKKNVLKARVEAEQTNKSLKSIVLLSRLCLLFLKPLSVEICLKILEIGCPGLKPHDFITLTKALLIKKSIGCLIPYKDVESRLKSESIFDFIRPKTKSNEREVDDFSRILLLNSCQSYCNKSAKS